MRLCLVILFFLLGCVPDKNIVLVKNTGRAQGTFYHIQYISYEGKDYQKSIDSILTKIDMSLSIYNQYSLISQLNRGFVVNPDEFLIDVFLAAEKVYNETDGYFDCTAYPLVKEWGFYKDILGDSVVIDSLKFKKVLGDIGFYKLTLDTHSLILPHNMSLDFNALAQGYTVDVIGNFLQEKNINNYLIELGGEILAKGKNIDSRRWIVGIEKPNEVISHQDRFQFIINLDNQSLATSGNYRRYYMKDSIKYSHTINPKTGFPANNQLLSVTVIHDQCMLADAYATAFMVMGVEATKKFVKERDDLEVYLVFTEDQKWKTFMTVDLKQAIIN